MTRTAWTDAPDTAVNFSVSLVIDGALPSCGRLDRDTLLKLADVSAGPATIQCFSGRHIRDVGQFRGVPLTRLLDMAGMQSLPRSQCKQFVIAAQAGDGYACLFTWHELYNSPIGAGVLILVEQDGEILPLAAGGLQLISLHDTRLGPRQAIALNRISVTRWQRA
ncbi:molybdopterin-dependent oxidoreductase [Cupriavidus sp. RAF12]|uniref:molybdopterin-dependent oxidoreductase n=1 Tax=Cupriavidus sp. RAF12 TaxID=3233050 RepID=UPI003F91EF96